MQDLCGIRWLYIFFLSHTSGGEKMIFFLPIQRYDARRTQFPSSEFIVKSKLHLFTILGLKRSYLLFVLMIQFD